MPSSWHADEWLVPDSRLLKFHGRYPKSGQAVPVFRVWNSTPYTQLDGFLSQSRTAVAADAMSEAVDERASGARACVCVLVEYDVCRGRYLGKLGKECYGRLAFFLYLGSRRACLDSLLSASEHVTSVVTPTNRALPTTTSTPPPPVSSFMIGPAAASMVGSCRDRRSTADLPIYL